MYALGFGGSGILILAVVLGFFAFAGGGGSSPDGTAVTGSKDCVEESFAGLPPKHLSNPDARVAYNSFPPSSGPHYQSPAPWGIYTDTIKQTILVHNLEHGGIVIQYGDVGADAVKKLGSFYQDDPYGLVVAPYKKLGKKFALTAWNEDRYRQEGDFNNIDPGKGFVMTCTKFDGGAFAKFRDAHRNKAGERYPSTKDMTPGQ
jgi:hypothetical protein